MHRILFRHRIRGLAIQSTIDCRGGRIAEGAVSL